MGITYASVVIEAFGKAEFAAEEFGNLLGSTRAAKILSELKKRGIVERTGRGRYRVLNLDERPDLRTVEWNRIREVIRDSALPKAWSGSTAVEIWTDGRYRISPNPYFREFELSIPESDLTRWRAYLHDNGISEAGKKRVGGTVILVPTRKFSSVSHNGENVIPRAEALALIREHPGLYANASELVDARP